MKAQLFNLTAQNFHASRVKSRSVDFVGVLAKHRRKPLAKLSRSLVCERNRENVPRIYRVNRDDFREFFEIFGRFLHLGKFCQKTLLIGRNFADFFIVKRVSEANHIRNPVYENRCFSAARARYYQNRAAHLENCLFLHIVRAGKTTQKRVLL